MLDIKILGADCVECDHMRDLVMAAMDVLVLRNAKVEVVRDISTSGAWLQGKSTPGLVVNGRLALAGHTPTLEDVIATLEAVSKS